MLCAKVPKDITERTVTTTIFLIDVMVVFLVLHYSLSGSVGLM